MSKFTGKEPCVYTELHGFNKYDTVEELLKNMVVKQYDKNGNCVELHWSCEKDAVPYYAHMIGVGVYNNGHSTIIISQNPYYITEERERLLWRFKNVKRYYMKCKRNKVEPTLDDMLNKIYIRNDNEEISIMTEIFNRVSKHPYSKKFDMSGIHLYMQNYYRNLLYSEMIKYGYTEEETDAWVNDGIKLWQ